MSAAAIAERPPCPLCGGALLLRFRRPRGAAWLEAALYCPRCLAWFEDDLSPPHDEAPS